MSHARILNVDLLSSRPRPKDDVQVSGLRAFGYTFLSGSIAQLLLLPIERAHKLVEYAQQVHGHKTSRFHVLATFFAAKQQGLMLLYQRAWAQIFNYGWISSMHYSLFFWTRKTFFPDVPMFGKVQPPEIIATSTAKLMIAAIVPTSIVTVIMHPMQMMQHRMFELMAANKFNKPPTAPELLEHIRGTGGFGRLWDGVAYSSVAVGIYRGVSLGAFYTMKPFIHPRIHDDWWHLLSGSLGLSLVAHYFARVLSTPFALMGDKFVPVLTPHVAVNMQTAILHAFRPHPSWITASLTLTIFDAFMLGQARRMDSSAHQLEVIAATNKLRELDHSSESQSQKPPAS